MGDQINVHFDVKGKGEAQSFRIPLTLEKVSEWIKLQEFDEYTTNGLIELASKYPNAALWQFKKNFNLMVSRVRMKRRKEFGGMDAVEETAIEEFVSEKIDVNLPSKTVQIKEELDQDYVEEV